MLLLLHEPEHDLRDLRVLELVLGHAGLLEHELKLRHLKHLLQVRGQVVRHRLAAEPAGVLVVADVADVLERRGVRPADVGLA